MRENRMKNLFITGIIILSILFLVFFNYYYYFVSPKMVEVNKVNEVVSLFEDKNKKSVEFESRYFSDESYYVASDNEYIYLFNEEGKLLSEIKKGDLDFERVNQIASETYESFSISLALYEEKVVYVIVNEKEDVYLSTEDFEEVFKVRKGI